MGVYENRMWLDVVMSHQDWLTCDPDRLVFDAAERHSDVYFLS